MCLRIVYKILWTGGPYKQRLGLSRFSAGAWVSRWNPGPWFFRPPEPAPLGGPPYVPSAFIPCSKLNILVVFFSRRIPLSFNLELSKLCLYWREEKAYRAALTCVDERIIGILAFLNGNPRKILEFVFGGRSLSLRIRCGCHLAVAWLLLVVWGEWC